MSTPLSLAGLHLESEAARFVEQQRQFRESVDKMYGHKDLSGDVIAHAISGSIKLMDALALARAIRATKPKRILEVGSFLGFSTHVIMDASEEFGSTVTSVDPRIRHRIFDDIKTHVTSFNPQDRLRCRDAFFCEPVLDGMYWDYLNYEPRHTREEADVILNGIEVIKEPFDTFDFAFIDGDHSYVATAENLLLAAQMMEPGSLIVLHDAISWPDVQPAAHDIADKIDGLDVVGIPGAAERDFFIDWWGKFPGLAQNPDQIHQMASSISDGLCVVKIDEGIDKERFIEQCQSYGRAHHQVMQQVRMYRHQRDSVADHRDVLQAERDALQADRDGLAREVEQLRGGALGTADKVLRSAARKLPASVKDRLRRLDAR